MLTITKRYEKLINRAIWNNRSDMLYSFGKEFSPAFLSKFCDVVINITQRIPKMSYEYLYNIRNKGTLEAAIVSRNSHLIPFGYVFYAAKRRNQEIAQSGIIERLDIRMKEHQEFIKNNPIDLKILEENGTRYIVKYRAGEMISKVRTDLDAQMKDYKHKKREITEAMKLYM
jgi:hypothetical protein